MKDVIKRMIAELPEQSNMGFADPTPTLWVIIRACKVSKTPEDPMYDHAAAALAQTIKSEPVLRAIPSLLAIAEEVVGADNIVMTPHAIVQRLDAAYAQQREAKA